MHEGMQVLQFKAGEATEPAAPSSQEPDFGEEYREAQAALGKKVPLGVKIAIVAVLVVMLFVSFALGKYPVPPDELVKNVVAQITVGAYNLFNDPDIVISDAANTALFNIRLPRIVVVMLVGAALSVAGAAYQGMFKNPLTSPDLLGASAGASFGACLALLLEALNGN